MACLCIMIALLLLSDSNNDGHDDILYLWTWSLRYGIFISDISNLSYEFWACFWRRSHFVQLFYCIRLLLMSCQWFATSGKIASDICRKIMFINSINVNISGFVSILSICTIFIFLGALGPLVQCHSEPGQQAKTRTIIQVSIISRHGDSEYHPCILLDNR